MVILRPLLRVRKEARGAMTRAARNWLRDRGGAGRGVVVKEL
jgi:hypothetical protein